MIRHKRICPELKELSKREPTIHAHLRTWEITQNMSYKEMLEVLIIKLAGEKKHYEDELIKALTTQRTEYIIIPKEEAEKIAATIDE